MAFLIGVGFEAQRGAGNLLSQNLEVGHAGFAGLLNALPVLQRQEAIAFGEGVPHPMRIRFAELDQRLRPKSNSASFHDAWKQDGRDHDFVDDIVERWRAQTY